MRTPFRSRVLHVLQGMAVGAANIIPGVSGGTMALIFGIYERLIDALGTLFKAGLSFARLDFRSALERIRSVEWGFVLSLGVGMVLVTVIGASFIPELLRGHPEASRGLFFGLIVGSLPIPWLRIRHRGMKALVVAILAASAAFLLVGIPPAVEADPGLPAIFLAAALAVCAMILPGVSGAYLLVLMGMYEPVLAAVDARDPAVIAVFILGAGLGLGSFALLLKRLLERAHDVTMAILVGLMAGSLRSLWPWQTPDGSLLEPAAENLPLIVGFLILGLLVTGGMALWEIRESNTIQDGPDRS